MKIVSAYKKKLRGFPYVFTFEIFETALKDDLRQWASRRRRRRRRRHRRSGSNGERKMKAIINCGEQEMNRMLRRGVLPSVRRRSSFVVLVVVFSARRMSVEK
ncbi:hypothetical protein [Absidia glauca]|uniref:Uncharacterized protein n=1 Tax=Absidia glauca TaxID=4829 RepID=A0A168LCZ3_ABSGL|nr:hypothetical protein [Absidia glauca]